MSGSGILGQIAAERAADAARERKLRPLSSLRREAGRPRPLFRGARSPFVIAECKRASPSRGLMVRDYDPGRIAAAYERGGASAVSVLTEPRHFLGSAEHLAKVRDAVRLPVLRKDFIVDPYQVHEAWAMGADAILLIAALLEPARIAELAACAHELGLEALFEIHGEEEVELVAAAPVDAVGVNSRNLSTFAVDHERPARLASRLPPQLPRVAESGLHSGEEAAALLGAGYGGFLVGELFVAAPDPEAAVRDFTAILAAARAAPSARGGARAAAGIAGGPSLPAAGAGSAEASPCARA